MIIGLLSQRSVEWLGDGFVAGEAPADAESPDGRFRILNVPSRGRIVVLDRSSLSVVAATLSAADGTWRIAGLDRTRRYVVAGFDDRGTTNMASQDWIEPAEVTDPRQPLQLRGLLPSAAVIGAAYAGTLVSSGAFGPVVWSVSGLPEGLQASATDAVLRISGVATAVAAAAVHVTALDGAGRTVSQTYPVASVPDTPPWDATTVPAGVAISGDGYVLASTSNGTSYKTRKVYSQGQHATGRYAIRFRISARDGNGNAGGVGLLAGESEQDLSWSNTSYSLWIERGRLLAYRNAIATDIGPAPTGTDTVEGMIEIDLAAQKVWIGFNGWWYGDGDPAAGVNPTFSGDFGGEPYRLVTDFYYAGIVRLLRPQEVAFGATPGFVLGWPD